jgi:mRNA interferase MazF
LRQYEIWWAQLPLPVGRRPVLLLSRDGAYAYLNKVVAVEITSTIRGLPVEVLLGARENLRRRCVANLDNLHLVPTEILVARIGTLAPSRIAELKQAAGYVFDWPELKARERQAR